MPYSSGKDAPAWVQKMGPKAAEQWVSVFNSVFKESGGDEQRAFAEAAAAVKKAHMNQGGSGVVHFVSVFAADQGRDGLAKAAILRTGTWRYRGDLLKVNLAFLHKVVDNFKRFRRQDEIMLDYEHGSALGKTVDDKKAAGWLQRLEVEDKGGGKGILWAFFKLVGDGLKYVRSGEYRFTSVELDRDFFHAEADAAVGPYLEAVGLTNRPFVEGLQGMTLLSKGATKLMEGTEGAARGSEPPDRGPRADDEVKVKINLSQYGGPAEGGEEDVGKVLASQKAALTAAEGRAAKAEGELKVLAAKVELAEGEKKALNDRMGALEQRDADREFERVFAAAKADPKGARAVEGERKDLRILFNAYPQETRSKDLEAYLASRSPVLATRPATTGGGGPAPETSAEAKFLAACEVEIQKAGGKMLFTAAAQKVAADNPQLERDYQAEQEAKASRLRIQGDGAPSGEVV